MDVLFSPAALFLRWHLITIHAVQHYEAFVERKNRCIIVFDVWHRHEDRMGK